MMSRVEEDKRRMRERGETEELGCKQERERGLKREENSGIGL